VKRAATLALLAAISACVPDPGRPDRTSEVYRAIVDAEDARPADGRSLDTLLDAADLEDPFLRRTAVRTLGRLEKPDLSASIVRHLVDPDPEVRATAAEALAQSVHRRDGGAVLDDLLGRIAVEEDSAVRGMLARSLGRLRLEDLDRRLVERALLELSEGGTEEPIETLVGVALGFEAFVRHSGGTGLSRPAAERLEGLLAYGRDGRVQDPAGGGHVRALAAAALGGSRRLSLALVRSALEDPEPEVRRTVLAYLNSVPPSSREALLLQALQDSTVRVATAAVQYLAGVGRTEPRCALLLAAAATDVPAPVRVAALEALAEPCPGSGGQRRALTRAAAELDDPEAPWQPAASALLSLIRIDPTAATAALPAFSGHASPFVRAYAARAAAGLRDVETLFQLAVDPSPNVRAEAVTGLFAVDGHGIDDFLVELLDEDDPWLLITVAGLLEGTPDQARVARAVLEAFERISAAERETWRDPRLALLARVAELGDASLADRMTPFLEDYDPAVAAAVAELLGGWTGQEHMAEADPLPRAPVPTLDELRVLEGSRLVLHMGDGSELVVELLPDQATTNVARLVRLAREGHYDGLTFHRWAPNFVIQGGSPHANEYQGDGPYTRDEVGGLPHWRGTVGLSTRGRDTGDGQIFVNLVDNVRLDYDYTVMGRLVDGYDVLDGILEGAVIERAEVVTAR
jgi:cyclophilin family peptidyl-prolyl cis-trans isomerase/HEAT repeat protein